MLIDRIYQKVKTFINTDIRGNVSPEEFNLSLHDAIQERNEEYAFEINRYQTKENRGMVSNSLENLPDLYREKILHYLIESEEISIVDGYLNLPDDYRYLDDINTLDNCSLEFCKSRKTFNIVKSIATKQYPIYLKSGNKILVFPESVESVLLSYLRSPNYPKWTYNVINGVELFNPDANDFVDADIHPSEEDEIVRRVLLRFGVNLKETDIQQYAVQDQSIEFNQNNSI